LVIGSAAINHHGHTLADADDRLTTTRELIRRQARYAVVSLCIGVGQGLAVVIERC
jgi:acetyl-CoA C-acetyltransferase